MQEIFHLREQLKSILELPVDQDVPPLPSSRQEILIRQIIASGFVDQIARLIPAEKSAKIVVTFRCNFIQGVLTPSQVLPMKF